MDVELDTKKLLIKDRVSFDIITNSLSNTTELGGRSIEWLEQAKQSVIYYMLWLYTEDTRVELLSSRIIVPYYSMKPPLSGGSKAPIGGHYLKNGDELLTLGEIIQLLRLMEATKYDDRDFSAESVERLNYVLYLFARRIDELNADKINDIIPSQANSLIKNIAELYKNSIIVFNPDESKVIQDLKPKGQAISRQGDNTSPIIFMTFFVGRLNIMCYSKKSNTVYFFNMNSNFEKIIPSLRKIVANYNGGESNEASFKFIAYNSTLPLNTDRYISYYILVELCKASTRGKTTKQSIRMIAPWLHNLDNDTMIAFKRFFIRTYLFPFSFLKSTSENKPPPTNVPIVVFDTSGEDDIIIEEDIDNNNNNNNNDDDSMVVTVIPTEPKKTKKDDKKSSKTTIVIKKKPIVVKNTQPNDNDIDIIPDTPDDVSIKPLKSMPEPLASNVVHLAILSDETRFISESILLDMYRYYFNADDNDPHENILLVDPLAWTHQIATLKKSTHKQTVAEKALLTAFNQKSIDTVLIPVFRDNHWSLVIILKESEVIYYYTSFDGDKFNAKSTINEFYKATRTYTYMKLLGPKQACDSVDCALFVLDALDYFVMQQGDVYDIKNMVSLWTRKKVLNLLIAEIKIKLDSGPFVEEFAVEQIKIYRTTKRTNELMKAFLKIMKKLLKDNDIIYNFVVKEITEDNNGQAKRETLEDAVRKLTITPDSNDVMNVEPTKPVVNDNNTTKKNDNDDIDIIISNDEDDDNNKKNDQMTIVTPDASTVVRPILSDTYYETKDPIDRFILWAIEQRDMNRPPPGSAYKNLENDLIYAGYNNFIIESIMQTMKNLFTSNIQCKKAATSREIFCRPEVLTDATIRKQLEKYRQYKR